MLARKDLKIIKHFENARECFPTVMIEGGVSYFYKVPVKTDCLFNGHRINLSQYDILVDPKYFELLEKTRDLPKIDSIFLNRGHYKVETNDKALHDQKGKNDIICYVSEIKAKNRQKYIDKKYLIDHHWKVITARANGNKKNFGYMKVISPDEIYTNSYIAFKVRSEQEGENLISYLKCKLPNMLLGARKISQDINTGTIKWIPLPPLDHAWNDELVEKYFL